MEHNLHHQHSDSEDSAAINEYLFMTHEYVLISSSQDRRVLDHIVLRCVMYVWHDDVSDSASHGEPDKENFDGIVIALHHNTDLFNSDTDRDVIECELKESDFVGIADVDAEVDCKTSLEVIFRTKEVSISASSLPSPFDPCMYVIFVRDCSMHRAH